LLAKHGANLNDRFEDQYDRLLNLQTKLFKMLAINQASLLH